MYSELNEVVEPVLSIGCSKLTKIEDFYISIVLIFFPLIRTFKTYIFIFHFPDLHEEQEKIKKNAMFL